MESSTGDDAVKKVALIVVATTTIVTTFMMSAVSIAIPTIGKEFAMEAVMMGWVATAMTLPQAALLLISGRLADIYGLKKIFLYGMLLFAVSTGLCAVATSGSLLITYRVLQGISGGMVFGISMALLTSVFPGNERGRALGINMAAAFVGIATGPFFGGVLTQHLGWRSIFFISAFLGLVVIFLIIWRLKGEWAAARGEKYDTLGSIVFPISIVILMYGFTLLPEITGITMMIAGILGLLLFGFLECRVRSPILDVKAFRNNRAFIAANLATTVNYLALFASTFLLSIYLQHIKGFTPQVAGLVLVASSVVIVICSPVAGRLSDRVEPRKVASLGLVFNCIGLSLLIFLGWNTAMWYILIALVLHGLGIGLFGPPNINAVMSSVDKKFFGVAAGTHGTMRSIGMMMSMGIVMILFSLFIGEAAIAPETYPAFLTSMKLSFIIFDILCFGGIFVQLFGGRPR